jgi:myo-inositol-1(or 4)-monophosphatase
VSSRPSADGRRPPPASRLSASPLSGRRRPASPRSARRGPAALPRSSADDLQSLLAAAERAVDAAAESLRQGRARVKALIDKGESGFATIVDLEIEALVRERLGAELPGVPFLGEEEGGAELSSDAVWVLDPIDGTANYADGSPLCAISLALLRRGSPVVAVVDAPLLGERYTAVEGGGTLRNGERVAVAAREVGDPLVALSDFAFGRKHRHTNQLRFEVIHELVRRSMRLRIHGSVALDLAWLAAGRMSGTIALSNRAWDVSAGVLLVREAGGLVFDEDGSPHAPDSSSTLAATPALRDALLEAVAAARAQAAR